MASIDDRSYWDNRAQQMGQEIREEAAFAVTPAGKLETARRKLTAMRADAGRYSVADIAGAQKVIDTLTAEVKAAEEARFAAEWTPEIIAARRVEWNLAVQAGQFTGRQMAANLAAWRREHDWLGEDLQRAVKLQKSGGN